MSQGVASENLIVRILQDRLTERTERFGVRIIIPESTRQLGVELGSPSELIVSILDDDRKSTWCMN